MLARLTIEYRPTSWFKPYARNPRKNDAVVDRIRASIREFNFAVPMLCKSDGSVIDGDLRLKGAIAENLPEIPVVICDGWTETQVKAFRIMVNRSVTWAEWDDELLSLELQELAEADYDLSLTGFDPRELEVSSAFLTTTSKPTSLRQYQRIPCPGLAISGWQATGATNTGSSAGTPPARKQWRDCWVIASRSSL